MSAVDEDIAMSDPESTTSLETMSSNNRDAALSVADGLNAEFYDAVKGFLNFEGSFYHHSANSWPDAPDPELTIEGVGKIALPLSEEDAQSIFSRASQAPFGKGVDTVVDKSVRDTWEVQPADISFGNADWAKFVHKVASVDVWKSLGVAPFTTPPRCELHKLLLYQTGSHFLPHQDSSKAEGMFATVVIVLPCDFEGGEVRVSHGGKSVTLDVAADAADCKFSVLAWYTDVVHEVKPVKSGYRLALSYNLIHTSPSLSRPSMPNMDTAVQKLRRVLQTWNDGGYKVLPKVPLLSYVLSHKYSSAELQKGQDCLKGVDAYLVEHLLPISQDLDFSVCLGHLTRTVKGDAGEERKNGDLVMIYVEEDTTEVSRLVRISSEIPFKLGYFEIQQDALVPRNYFESAVPDSEDFEGYTGNDGAPLEHQYFGSVVVLFRNADQTSIVTRVKGLPWVLEHRESTSLNLDIRTAAVTAISCLKEVEPRNSSYSEPTLTDGAAEAISELALEWEDATLWCDVPTLDYASREAKAKTVKEAAKLFDLDIIRPALLQYVVDYRESFRSRVNAIEEIARSAGEKASRAWLDALTQDTLATYDAGDTGDVKLLASFASRTGLGNVLEILFRQLGNRDESGRLKGEYPFFLELAKALYHDPLPETSDKSRGPTPANDLTRPEAIRKCIFEAIARWERPPRYANLTNELRAKRICEIVDVSLTVQDIDPCIQFLFSILNLQPNTDVAAKFRDTYRPLVHALTTTLKKHEKDATHEPFRAFFKAVISLYLQHILGSVDVAPPLPQTEFWWVERREQPGQEFSAFANSSEPGPIRISGVQKCDLSYFKDDYTEVSTVAVELTDRLRKRYTVTIQKKPEALIPYTWESRHAAALAFLATVADEDGLRVIMGEGYIDLKMALDGEKAFSSTK